ncbi:MAG: asparagine synthase (glutamine-hydrolyzing) [Lachnospiraceae bacterium]|nr:asparagine synthase (glutamine-hydrolyzing) [Lachnospiraceae bacterium]
MCGIFGVINKKTDARLADKCVDRMAHRGPDGRGIWQEKGTTLGHRRLAILDLTADGAQPMLYGEYEGSSSEDESRRTGCSGDGRYVLCFNGEIYNFVEIREELKQKGYSFKSDSDSEVLLVSFIEWKEDCLKRFNGMWAFLIWDRLEEKLFVSRDRYGVKPLFYAKLPDNAIAFGSEMKAITPLMDRIRPDRKLVTDPERIVFYESTEECVIEGISRFPAGCYAYADKNGMRIERYYNTLDNLVTLSSSYEEQVEMFRELFLDACRLRMRSDVTIGTALSGGLDSSATICAMAHLSGNDVKSDRSEDISSARMNKDWQHAYVATFPGTTMDESEYAKKVTDYLGIDSTFVKIDPRKAIGRLDDFIYMFEDVYLTSPIPMMILYGELRRDNTIVTIDGHGADELFGGYTFDFIHALRDARGSKEKNMVLDAYIGSFPKDGSNIALKNSSRTGIKLNYMKRRLKDRLRQNTQDYKMVRAAGDKRYERMDTLNKILYASSHETILPTLLRNYDRYSMANSVEIRMPFMDHRIVEMAMSLGWKSKLHGGYSKSIIRDAMAPFMPHDIAYRRTKIGFNTPIVEWMQGPLKEYFTDILDSESFKSCDLIDPRAVTDRVNGVIGNKDATFAMGEQAWSALYPYLWQENVLKRL